LHDLLARWSAADEPEAHLDEPLPVIYPDNLMTSVLDGFESLAVAASESMQHQTYAAILTALAVMFPRLQPGERQRAEDVVLRSLSGLGDHILTRDLDEALADMAGALDLAHAGRTAQAIRVARSGLAESIGRLNSRSTRVPTA
jgi:hypothetical protein